MASASKYTYPSSINVANFVSMKLTQTNYLLWRTQIMSLIESQEVSDFITGKMEIPAEEIVSDDGKTTVKNPDFMSWIRTDRLVKAWITGTLSEDVLGLAVGLETSADVW